MKFLTTVSCEDEFANSARYALIDLSDDMVTALRRYRLQAEAIAKTETSAFHYIAIFAVNCEWIGNPREEDDDVEDITSYLEPRLNLSAEDWQRLDRGDAVRVPNDVQVPETYWQRAKMQQLRVTCDSFCFVSDPDECGVYQSSADIGFRDLG